MSKINAFDEAASRLIAKLPSSSLTYFRLMSRLGHPITICCIAGAIAAAGLIKNIPVIMLGGIFIWITIFVSTIVKNLTKRSRPLTDYVAGMRIRSFSFPSGHTAGSTITFGLLAWYALQSLPTSISYVVTAILALMTLSVGISRIYLGAHYPTDVIGGWMLGAAALTALILVTRQL